MNLFIYSQTEGPIASSYAGPTSPTPILHTGQVSSFRWRGPRQSKPLISLMEAVITDVSALARRTFLARLYPDKSLTVISLTAGIYGLGTADPRNDPYVEGISNLGPLVWQLNMIQIQSLRSQLDYRLSADN